MAWSLAGAGVQWGYTVWPCAPCIPLPLCLFLPAHALLLSPGCAALVLPLKPHSSPAVSNPPSPLQHRFSWNKSQLEKARNEGGTQTNPLATALRGVLTGVPTAVLVVASITRLSDTSYNK